MPMFTRSLLVFVTATFGYVASAQAQAPAPIEQVPDCPTFVRGSKLAVSNVDRGVAARLTTKERAYVGELRQMIREFQRLIDEKVEEEAVASANGTAQASIPPLDIAVEDIAGGALVTVRAERLADVAMVRDQARGIESFWETSACTRGEAAAWQ